MSITPSDYGTAIDPDATHLGGNFYQIVPVYLVPAHWVEANNCVVTKRHRQMQDVQVENDSGADIDYDVQLLLSTSDNSFDPGNIPLQTMTFTASTTHWKPDLFAVQSEKSGEFWRVDIFTEDPDTLPAVSVEEINFKDGSDGDHLWIHGRQSRPRENQENDEDYDGGQDQFVEICGRFNVTTSLWAGHRPASAWLISRVLADTINCIAYHGIHGMATTAILNWAAPPP